MEQSRTQQLRKAAADRSRRRNGPAGGLVEVTCRRCTKTTLAARREVHREGVCPYCQAPTGPEAA